MRRRFVLYVLLILPLSLWASGSVNNIGFEYGFEGWKFYVGKAENSIVKTSIYDTGKFPIEVLTPDNSQYSSRFTLYPNSSGSLLDDNCSQHEIQQNSGMGNKFLKLGDKLAGSNCEKVSYSFQYSENMNSVIRYAYALVLEEPNNEHPDYAKPAFIASIMIVRDGDTITNNDECTIDHYFADQKFSELKVCKAQSFSNILVMPWSYNTFDLKALKTSNEVISVQDGDLVILSFATFDCTQGAHYGYAYVDAEFVNSNFEIDGVADGDSLCWGKEVTLRYPGAGTFVGETYEWKVNGHRVGDVSKNPILNYRFKDYGWNTVSLTIRVNNGDLSSCVQEHTIKQDVYVGCCLDSDIGKITIDGMSVDGSLTVCKNQLLRLGFRSGVPLTNPQYVWTFGNDTLSAGNESLDEIPNFSTSTFGTLALRVTSSECGASVNFAVNLNVDNCIANKCNDCPSRFSPTPGEKYVVSGWVSAASQIGVKDSFEDVSIQLSFDLIGGGDPMVVECYPDGNIIDGWQRISKSFVIPSNAENMRIALKNESGDNDVYFDDIRFHPFNASVKGYVYDPKTLRLAAELDDENYATFYEYDEEGALIRIKKETERGVMTIREARQSKPKISGGN